MSKRGNPDAPENATRYQPEKTCPVCEEEVKGLPYHIRQHHAE